VVIISASVNAATSYRMLRKYVTDSASGVSLVFRKTVVIFLVLTAPFRNNLFVIQQRGLMWIENNKFLGTI